jgi:hypothetical protein
MAKAPDSKRLRALRGGVGREAKKTARALPGRETLRNG